MIELSFEQRNRIANARSDLAVFINRSSKERTTV